MQQRIVHLIRNSLLLRQTGGPMPGVSGDGVLLIAALGWSASAVAGGVLGDAAFDLLMQLLQ